MKLTVEQIDKIDVILDKLGLDFLDIKLEVKDHIACQVEEKMSSREISFDTSLKDVLKCWESKLVLRNSWLISNKKSFPKIVIQKLFKRFLIYNTTLLFFSILSFYFFYSNKESIDGSIFISKYSILIYSSFLPRTLSFGLKCIFRK